MIMAHYMSTEMHARVGVSEHGVGVLATKFIPKGTVIFTNAFGVCEQEEAFQTVSFC